MNAAPVMQPGIDSRSEPADCHEDGSRDAVASNSKVVTSADGAFCYELSSDQTIRITEYRGHAPEVVIPSTIDGYVVTALASKLFFGHSELVSLTMPNSIKSLGRRICEACTSLRHIIFSESLERIDPSSFGRCRSLTEVRIPSLVRTIEGRTFGDCPISVLHLGRSVRTIAQTALDSSHVEHLSIDEDNPYLSTDGRALFTADKLQLIRLLVPCASYEVPPGCRVIGDKAFDTAENLVEVTLPETLLRIGRLAFAKSAVRSIDIPSSVTLIDEKAFYYCKFLTEVTLHEGLRSIRNQAFAYAALDRVLLPCSLEELGYQAFFKTNIVFSGSNRTFLCAPESPHIFCDEAGGLYQGDTFIELLGSARCYEVVSGTRTIAAAAFKWQGTLRRVVIPAGLVNIEDEAFRGCRNLESLELPETLEWIGDRAFLDTGLRSIQLSARVLHIGRHALHVQGTYQPTKSPVPFVLKLDSSNPRYYIESGLFCERSAAGVGDVALLFVGPCKSVHVPSQVTYIDDYAFFAVDTVREIFFHAGIRGIGASAFCMSWPIEQIHIDYPRPVDGQSHVDILIPAVQSAGWTFMKALSFDRDGTLFNYALYDSCVIYLREIQDIAQILIRRLIQPIKLSKSRREMYERIIEHHISEICAYYAACDEMGAYEVLVDLGFLQRGNIDAMIRHISLREETKATGYLLELKHRRFGVSSPDFSL
jgi:hypothetical protein